LGHFDRSVYVTTVMLGAAATGALIAPVSLHRIVTGHRLKPETVAWAARFTMAGLVLLLCTVVSALLLILRFVLQDRFAWWFALGILIWFAACWFLPAAVLRRRARHKL
jgi:Na+-transporting NADH:ubiquinone oxidoreductase subunit NqrE